MEVTGFAPTASNPAGAQDKSSLSSLTDKFDNFLLLLTKQLQYQDPLSPLDTNEFTSQLVQFTDVEQAINTNNKLDQLLGLQANNQAMGALAFLGNRIEADSPQILLKDGASAIHYELSQDAAKAVITILDASGKPVRIADASGDAGQNSFTWDGQDNNGVDLPDGTYSVQVTAVDKNGKTTEVANTIITGKVSGVELANGEIILSVGDIQVPASQVRSVQQPTTAEAGSDDTAS